MTRTFSRRRLLASAAALGAAGAAPALAQAPGAIRLAAERRTLDIDGRAATVFGLQQPDGTPGVRLAPGERFRVDLANRSGEPTIVHWHGQTPPARQDGVADTGLAAVIGDGGSAGYDFLPRPGTHWMHSHQGLQEQRLMAAPLIVGSPEDQRLDAQEVVVLLHDFSFRDPAEILAQLTKAAEMPMGHGGMAGMQHSGMQHSGMAMPMDLNDVDFDAYLANDRTLGDPLVVRAERGGRVRLRVINGATSTAFWLDLGRLDGTVLAVDGNPVLPVAGRRWPLAQGQRLDVLMQLPPGGGAFPVVAQREGDRRRTGIILATPGATIARVAAAADQPAAAVDLSLDRGLQAMHPLSGRQPDVVHPVTLAGSMMPYAWSIDDRTWTDHRPLVVSLGQRVALDIVNRSAMAHPMHLHGHHFQIVGIDGAAVAGPMRDTVLVPVNGRVQIAFEADNPGRWLFHCHNLYHMAAGMMTEIAYRDVT